MKVMDTGATVGLLCTGPDTFAALAATSAACRAAVSCPADAGPPPPAGNSLTCTYEETAVLLCSFISYLR